MEQIPHVPTYTVAWFKLAQCVTNGQKERAIGMFKLLSHSLTDKAFMHQVEGDLYLSFTEKNNAIKAYEAAAQEYIKNNKLLEAALVYDHLSILNPSNSDYVLHARQLYIQLESHTQALERTLQLIAKKMQQHEWQVCYEFIQTLNNNTEKYTSTLTKLITHMLDQNNYTDHMSLLKQCIDDLMPFLAQAVSTTDLQKFLLYLENTAPELHAYAKNAQESL